MALVASRWRRCGARIVSILGGIAACLALLLAWLMSGTHDALWVLVNAMLQPEFRW